MFGRRSFNMKCGALSLAALCLLSLPLPVLAASDYADTLTTSGVAGVAPGKKTVDIYIYGPNNGNIGINPIPQTGLERVGPLVFNMKHVPVVKGRWSVVISPPLPVNAPPYGDVGYYQINIGHPMHNADSYTKDWDLTTKADGFDDLLLPTR